MSMLDIKVKHNPIICIMNPATTRSISRYVQQGMPYHGENRTKYFVLDEVMDWMKDQPKLFERYVELKIKIGND